MSSYVHDSADVAESALIGEGSRVWHLAQVRDGAIIDENVIIGRGAYIGTGVRVGPDSKIQNYALVYEPATLEAGVFVGPAAVLTNDAYPRAVNPDLTSKAPSDWEAVGVTIRTGAAVGARAVCIAPVTLGKWSTVAAGAVVTRDTPDYALVAGVPARQIGWVGKSGRRLVAVNDGSWRDPHTDEIYQEVDGELRETGEKK